MNTHRNSPYQLRSQRGTAKFKLLRGWHKARLDRRSPRFGVSTLVLGKRGFFRNLSIWAACPCCRRRGSCFCPDLFAAAMAASHPNTDRSPTLI